MQMLSTSLKAQVLCKQFGSYHSRKAAAKCFEENKTRKQSVARGTQTRIQQIKYYWGWCHRHKNAWKLAEHVWNIFSHFPAITEDVQQFLCWRLIFPKPFQFSPRNFPATLPLSLPSTRCEKENSSENLFFVVSCFSIAASIKLIRPSAMSGIKIGE